MEIREGCKKTEIGVIPEEWDLRILGDCLEEKPKYGINAAAVPYDSKLPAYIRITDISEEGRFIKENRSSVICNDSDKYRLQKNDIVFARTGASTGKSYLFNPPDGKLVYAGFLIRTRINEGVAIPRYVKACVEAARFWDWVKMTSTRSGQPGINGNEYATFVIPVPSLPEQQAIATALSDIDALISSLTKLIDKKKNIKQGTMQELLTGKKRLGGFSGEWEKVQMGEIAEITMGQSPDSKFYNTNRFGIPLVQGNADIEERRTIVRNYTSQITKRAKKGDIIMTVRAPVGFIGKAMFDCCLGRGVCSIKYTNEYLYHYLIFIENNWSALSKGSTFDSVNSIEVNELELTIPLTLEEQNAIAIILSDMDAEIEQLEIKLNKYKDIKQGMMQELLTGRIRLLGEVV